MISRNLIAAFIILIVSCSQTIPSGDKKIANEKASLTNQFPIQKAIATYNELLEIKSNYNYISIDTASIKLLTENKIAGLDNFEIYRFVIFNGAHYEYNSGQIICIGLVSKSDANDIRILLPKDYAKSSSNFFDPFLNRKVSDKKDYCTKLSNLINNYAAYPPKDIKYSYLDDNNLLTVISKHTVQSYDITTKTNVSFLQADTVQFTFSGDIVKSFLRVDVK